MIDVVRKGEMLNSNTQHVRFRIQAKSGVMTVRRGRHCVGVQVCDRKHNGFRFDFYSGKLNI